MPASAAPSGEQIELTHGDQSAVVTEVGAGLRTYSAAGREALDGYREDELASSGRGQLLIPWPNRIQDGVYEHGGRHYQLDLSEPAHSNAIHGLVRWSSWTVSERATERVVLEHVLRPQPGYPFTLELRVEYALFADGLAVTIRATNAGTDAAPYGAGAHPYFALGAGGVDETVLQVPARTVLEADDRGIPVDSSAVSGELDFRTSRAVGATRLDHCFTDLERGEDGLARVGIGETALWVDASFPYLMVFTGDGLPDVERRSLAVEPMTCAPNAFRSGAGLIGLEPGETHEGVWGITPGPER